MKHITLPGRTFRRFHQMAPSGQKADNPYKEIEPLGRRGKKGSRFNWIQKSTSFGPPARRAYASESVVRVNWLCLEAMPWSIGVLEYWVQRIEDSVVFSILVFALLHYSITPSPQRNSEITDTTSPLWGQIKATSSGHGFFTGGFSSAA